MKVFEKFLIVILWFITTILFISFWFNYKFSFNILSPAHWKYLRDMQISSVSINPFFYISIILLLVLSLMTLYLIIKPKFRKINLVSQKNSEKKLSFEKTSKEEKQIKYAEDTTNIKRPPRLNIQNLQTDFKPKELIKSANYNQSKIELENMFKKAGYIVKKVPYNLENLSLIAIGADENMWIGGANITNDNLKSIRDKFINVFSETLDDVSINLNLFIINSENKNSDEDIIRFSSIPELESFISNNKSIITEDEKEDFDAYSEYVDVVIEYLSRQK